MSYECSPVAGCGEFFGSLESFDAHLDGSRFPAKCRPPAKHLTRGKNGVWVDRTANQRRFPVLASRSESIEGHRVGREPLHGSQEARDATLGLIR